MSIIGTILRFITEREARKHDLDSLSSRLEDSGKSLSQRVAQSPDTPRNRAQIQHIVGIERWGQRRLRSLLGEPLAMDEYDSFRPANSLDMPALKVAFEETRAATVTLARELKAEGVAPTRTVPHNDMANLSLRGWLLYLNNHATRESSRLR